MVVDGDEDFVEEYGQAEEGKEWRHLARGGGRRRVQEWCALSLVRPVPPVVRALNKIGSTLADVQGKRAHSPLPTVNPMQSSTPSQWLRASASVRFIAPSSPPVCT